MPLLQVIWYIYIYIYIYCKDLVCTIVCVCVCIYIYILLTEYTRVGICLSIILNLLSAFKYTPRSRRRRWASDCITFLTRHNWEGSGACRFSLATFSLKFNNSSILTFSGVCCAVLHTRQTFYCRIACWNNSFGRVTWEGKYDVGRPKICKDPKNITDKAILYTLWVCGYYIYMYILVISSQHLQQNKLIMTT